MGKQNVPTFRGKCESSTMAKSGRPKHAGNFSWHTHHEQSLRFKDYRVWRTADGHLIVGEHTPLLSLVPTEVVQLAMFEPTFDNITLRWFKTVGGKRYDANKHLSRFNGGRGWNDFEFIYREEIYTDGDFNYDFPNY